MAALAGVAAVATTAPAVAVERLEFSAGGARGPGWSAGKIITRLERTDGERLRAVVEVNGLRLPGPVREIAGLRVTCADLRVTAGGVDCPGGELRLRATPDGPDLGPARWTADHGKDGARVRVQGLAVGSGDLDVTLNVAAGRTAIEASAEDLSLEVLRSLLAPGAAGSVPGVQSGTLSGRAEWRSGVAEGRLAGSLTLKDASFSDPSGLKAGEGAALEIEFDAGRDATGWRFDVTAAMPAGQVYLHPVFVDASAGAVRFSAAGALSAGPRRLILSRFRYRHDPAGAFDGRAELAVDGWPPRLDRIELRTEGVALAPLNDTYIAPWLLQSAFAGLKLSGRADARLSWARDGPAQASLDLSGVQLRDARERFSVTGLNGALRWRDSGVAEQSRLSFEGGRFYRLDIGPAELVGRAAGPRFGLEAPLELRLLGGALRVRDLEARGLMQGDVAWRLRADAEELSLDALTRQLGWPPFTGSLSGSIPAVRYSNGEMNVDGVLGVRAFDGRAEIRGLKLAQPFGVVPRLTADVALTDLSLGALTRTFSFGNIEGRLSGRIDDLVLENWRPAAFDAEFATPRDDTSRHRISQRAVENLARLGGAGRVLSSTLLGFLKSFSYDRLGLSCRLKNGVCEMGGIEAAEQGYYIVKGGGFPPRIDVFGFNTRVDWDTLVDRLEAITRAEDAVVR